MSSAPWIDLSPDLEVADWEFVCPMCNLVKPKRLASTVGRYVVCGECADA